MKIVVTGGAGFIGSNLIEYLNDQNINDIIVVDSVDEKRFKNLSGLKFEDVISPEEFLKEFEKKNALHIASRYKIVHLGANSHTTAKGCELFENNFEYSKKLLRLAAKKQCKIIYASSASIYGSYARNLSEHWDSLYARPLNLYGFTKLCLDNICRSILNSDKFADIVGLRIFNCYGPREFHKDGQSSPHFRMYKEIKNKQHPKLLVGEDGLGNDAKNHSRDFIYVKDVCDVINFFLNNDHPDHSSSDFKTGIFNLGSGKTHTFKDVYEEVKKCWERYNKTFDFTPELLPKKFPEHLKGRSQPYTRADIKKLRKAGYKKPFTSLSEGTRTYVLWLAHNWDYFNS